MKIGFFKRDPKAAAVWRAVGDGGAEVLVRPMNNPDARRAYAPVERKFGKVIRRGNLSEDNLVNIYSELIARHVLGDWRGLEDDAGKTIKFSPAKAQKLFAEYPAFLVEVIDLASEYEAFRREEVEKVAENLGNG